MHDVSRKISAYTLTEFYGHRDALQGPVVDLAIPVKKPSAMVVHSYVLQMYKEISSFKMKNVCVKSVISIGDPFPST